ncbi:MAG: thioredoxin fold domain-containing protein [Bacilli bacterium]|nr:thioredoxin fold domain-containing protein [Bacilli bacterium]
MKKILNLLLIMLMCLALIPYKVLAEEKTYNSLNLESVLKEEEIEHNLSNYSENNDQVTIYLFRGKGCTYCRAFLNFLNSIVDEYGKYFKLVSYEVWYDEDNNKLMDEVSEYLDKPADGVPYIIIGDEVFVGYSSSYDDEIKNSIKKLYDSKDRYDVMDEIKNNTKIEKEKSNTSNFSIIVFNLVVTILAVIVVMLYDRNKRYELMEKIEQLEKKLNKKTNNEK